jgi:undecaprenyl-diphosphatase
MFVFSLATSIYFFGNKKVAVMLYASGLLIGIARIAAGVHYPLDILGGIILGTLTGYIAYRFLGKKDSQ